MFWLSDNSDWQFCSVFFRKKLKDGTSASGHLMRRRINGAWQYRKLTHEEELEWLCVSAW